MAKTVKEVLEMGKNVKMVDLRFIDLPGTWQHFSIPAHRLDEELFEEGIPFDGSSMFPGPGSTLPSRPTA